VKRKAKRSSQERKAAREQRKWESKITAESPLDHEDTGTVKDGTPSPKKLYRKKRLPGELVRKNKKPANEDTE
jgi:hypothetical protein